MGRRTIAVSAVAAVCTTFVASGTAAVRHPALKITRADPLTVRGTAFHPRERVRVTLVADKRGVHVVRTSAAGTFTTVFDDVSISSDRCGNGLILSAHGSTGDAAILKRPQPECPPALGP